jgi:hypothetical protein
MLVIPKSIKIPKYIYLAIERFLEEPTSDRWIRLGFMLKIDPSPSITKAWLSYWLLSELCVMHQGVRHYFVSGKWTCQNRGNVMMARKPGGDTVYQVPRNTVSTELQFVSKDSLDKLERWMSLTKNPFRRS